MIDPDPPPEVFLLKYHQFRARLGMGDLHPGGIPATNRILQWLGEHHVQRVLEVGAGIGNTASRMVALGWDVTALEPDPILFRVLQKRVGARARDESFLDHQPTQRYDAIVAESVFFQMDLPRSFAHARALLEPGGHLAFVEAVWTDKITARTSRELHERTLRLFGIAVGSYEPLTARDWCHRLSDSGFDVVRNEPLPNGSAGSPPTPAWGTSIRAVCRDPRLMLWMARFRMRKRLSRMPFGVQESCIFLARAAQTTESSPT
jgi:SAM-dependent methyltransferase